MPNVALPVLPDVPSVAAERSASTLPLTEKTVYIPYMSDHALVLAAALRHHGIRSKALPPPNDETMDIGEDAGTPVSEVYHVPFRFTGQLETVTLDLK